MVSIVMSCYKEPLRILQESISSIFDSSRSDIELVLVIDNPTNIEISDWATRLARDCGNVKILRNENNLGLAMSLNKAIDCSEGEYICRMDADDIAECHRNRQRQRCPI